MFKSIKNLFTFSLFAVILLATTQMYSQVPANTFGINAEFGSESDEVGLFYTLSPKIEVGLGVTYMNKSYTVDQGKEPDSETTLGFSLYSLYFLSKGDVNPYIGALIRYTGLPEIKTTQSKTTTNEIVIGVFFGAETFVTKSFSVYADIGFGYQMNNRTETVGSVDNKYGTNTFSSFSSAIGAAFYF